MSLVGRPAAVRILSFSRTWRAGPGVFLRVNLLFEAELLGS